MIYDDLILEDKEEIKPIDGYEDYYVTNLGNIYSYKKEKWRKLHPYYGNKKKYPCINLNNRPLMVHRLVAKAFIPNPNNLPEVNHKDKNIHNPKADNLEWCTRKENLNDSYSTMSPVRNFNTCKLYKDGIPIGDFKSITKASEYAKKYFQASESSLSKYLKCKNIEIIPDNKTGNYEYKNHTCQKSYNKSKIRLYKNGYFQKDFKSFSEMSIYYKDVLHINISGDGLRQRFYRKQIIDGYEIRRE